jgi:hypothetical protein
MDVFSRNSILSSVDIRLVKFGITIRSSYQLLYGSYLFIDIYMYIYVFVSQVALIK